MSAQESQKARSPPSALSGGLSQINTCDHACKHSAEGFATHRACRPGLPGTRRYGRDLVSTLKAASRGQGRFPVLATCSVEDRLEPALAGRARSFIAHFHALQEPSVQEISLEFPVKAALLVLFNSLGPLKRFEGDGHLAPGAGTFFKERGSRGRSPSEGVLNKGSVAFPGGLK